MIIAAQEIQQSILETFFELLEKKSLAHAYLLTGASGVGKSETALAVAKWLNCENEVSRKKMEACGTCSSCVKILAGYHPDVYRVTDDETGTIKIDQIRDILSQFHLRPFMAQKKVFIIKDVEKMTTDAANVLLKTLEEPSASNLIILTSSHMDKVLATVKSRCQIMYVSSLPQNQLAQNLVKQGNITSDQAEFVAYLSEGSAGQAQKLIDNNILSLRNKIVDQFIFSKNSDDFIKQVLSDKDNTRLFLKILLAWNRDAILLKAGVYDNRITFQDKKRDLTDFIAARSFAMLDQLYQQIIETYKLFADNFNIKTSVLIIREMLWEKR